MDREKREAIIARVKEKMNSRSGLTATEIHKKIFPQAELFNNNAEADLTVAEIEEALRDEARDTFGIVTAVRRSRRYYFRLKRERRPRPGKPFTDTDDTKKIGTGGEYIVLSELLFRGYQANIMSVDDGIDIVASKDNKIFFVQVKTTYMDNNRVCVQIPISSFERVKAHDVRYFIVVREGYGRARILMLHQHDIITNAANGYIDKSNTNYNIKIEFRSDGIPVLYNAKGDNTRIPSATQELHKFDL